MRDVTAGAWRLSSSIAREPDLLHLIEAHLVAPAIVELRVRVEAWFAMAAAFSSVPPFFRYAVMPVARKV
jgi:hypothetical protein